MRREDEEKIIEEAETSHQQEIAELLKQIEELQSKLVLERQRLVDAMEKVRKLNWALISAIEGKTNA